jgi:hypothetical protein
MGNVRTRITKKTGPVRTTTSWGGKRGITTSTSYGEKGMRTTYSTNQKTGRSRTTQSQKVGQNSWYVTSNTTGGFSRKRGRKYKIKPGSDIFWSLVILGIIIMFMM